MKKMKSRTAAIKPDTDYEPYMPKKSEMVSPASERKAKAHAIPKMAKLTGIGKKRAAGRGK